MPSEDEYQEIFDDFTAGGEWSNEFDAFYQMYIESGADDDEDTWFEFLNTFVPEEESGEHDRQFWDDMRESYYNYSGVTDDNIDWALWREIVERHGS